LKEKHLTKKEIQELFPLVNTGREYYVNTQNYEIVDKIIELWFRTQGYDFWNNPFPEVVEWSVTKDKEIEFVYVLNEA